MITGFSCFIINPAKQNKCNCYSVNHMLGEMLWFFEANPKNSGFLSPSTIIYTSFFFFFAVCQLNSGPCTITKLSSVHFKPDIHETFIIYNLRQLFTICQPLCFTKLPTFSCHHLPNSITERSLKQKRKTKPKSFCSVLWLGFLETTKPKIKNNYFKIQKLNAVLVFYYFSSTS